MVTFILAQAIGSHRKIGGDERLSAAIEKRMVEHGLGIKRTFELIE